MIIEFMGIPGAGKTTLHRSLMAALRNAGSDVRSAARDGDVAPGRVGRLRRFGHYVAAGWRWRAALSIFARVLLRSNRSWAEKLFAFRLSIVALARYRIATSMGGAGLVLLDEGYLQRCFTLLIEGPAITDPALIERLVAVGPRADLVIHVRPTPETAVARLNGRAQRLAPRLAALSTDDLTATFRFADELFGRMADALNSDRSATVIAIESDDMEHACQTVLTALGTPPLNLAAR